MRLFCFLSVLFFQFAALAQKPCEFTVNVSDSLGNYHETRDYLMFERNFGGKSSYVYFSFSVIGDKPFLKVQLIDRSKDFIAANCLDRNSKLYLQLDNGKIITLSHIDEINCGTSIRNDEGFNNRILTGTFNFTANSVEELMKSPVSLLRIKFTTENADYILLSQLVSELDKSVYDPQRYMLTMLECLTAQ